MTLILHRLLKGLISMQAWIALCAWALAASAYHMVYRQFLPWQEGCLVALFTWSAYLLYYASNKQYPWAKFLLLPISLSTFGVYVYCHYPKPLFLFGIATISALYLIPIQELKRSFRLYRWGLLSMIWAIFPFFFSLKSIPFEWTIAFYFAFRCFFVANLCFIFFIKDEAFNVKEKTINNLRRILLIGQSLSVLVLGIYHSFFLALALGLITFFTYRAYRKQHLQKTGPYFYPIETDGIMILESIFVQSLNLL